MILDIFLLAMIAVLITWNIYDNIKSKKLLEKHIRHIDEQAEYIRELEKLRDDIQKVLRQNNPLH
ncbi:hypothetical protein U9K52_08570 [Chryseobacterium sp. MHB01]|uniref:hypothetical protein n=1 Tax=Chryseobacterium sp. MHB01 TaxID=3109433 RepID=UPI002AFFA742|nr:hypothetical protein [Chryseobacterium sp. MHB01]MEA1848962.1 hypothetical protein [Chryseobacterium sp. MHB01]